MKPNEEHTRKIQNNPVVADIIKPARAAGSENQPTFNTRITKATIIPAANSSVKAPATSASVQAPKHKFEEYGRPAGNKGVATTVKLNGKIVATKVSEPSHPVKSAKVSYNGKGTTINHRQ